jgi:integrase
VGKDSRDTVKAARGKAQAIDSDITFDRFDPTLAKYGKSHPTVLEIVSAIQPSAQISLRQLWDKFLEDKCRHVKAKTQDEYLNFTRLLDKLGDHLTFDALRTKEALLSVTTIDQARRLLQYLSACCNWGIKHRLISDNPYHGLAAELPKRRSVTHPMPDSFTEQERDTAIAAFKNDQRPGMNFRHYAPLVEFWFFAGCRPSEAIGLKWGKVSDDCSIVCFDGSIQTVRGALVWSEGSKNNKSRSIAVSSKVQELLLSIKPEIVNPDSLVFPSPKGNAIRYPNFLTKVWRKVVDPIKSDTTPYNCRDTFITLQLLKGVPSAVIAKWCDTSTSMIDKNYADKLKLSQLRPVD